MQIKKATKLASLLLILLPLACFSAKSEMDINRRLEKLQEQNTTLQNTADRIDNQQNRFVQQFADKVELLTKTINNSGTIKYGGAWTVMVCGAVMVVLFLSAIIFSVWLFVRNLKITNLLKLVTETISESPDNIQKNITSKIDEKTSNGGPFGVKHKQALSKLVKKLGTDARNIK